MIKDTIISNILFEMQGKIDTTILTELKNSLVINLYNYEIIETTTALSIVDNDDVNWYR